MLTHNTVRTGVAALVVCLALAACGDPTGAPATQGDQGSRAPGSLEVACVPQAEVLVDGTSYGTTPTTVSLDPGQHAVELRRERFVSLEATVDIASGGTATIDAVLVGADPGDPEVIQALAEASELEFTPFERPETTRSGRRRSEAMATLLWPKKDVRLEGLTTFCIEVSLDYTGDGYLEFRKGRKVVYREPFEPDLIITVGELPPAVREAVKVGDAVTWGLTFDNKRDNVMAKFKVVRNRKVAARLEKLERSRHFQRQPPITQALLRAQVFENYRLYSESLLYHLAVANQFPTSGQPYQGIVNALRRLDGESTQLWDLASEQVSGRGGRSARPGTGGIAPATGTPAASAAPLEKWKVPSVAMGPDGRQLGPYDAVTPKDRPEEAGTPSTPPATEPPLEAPATGTVTKLVDRAQELAATAAVAQQRSEDLTKQAEEAKREAAEADERRQDAEGRVREYERIIAEAEGAPLPEDPEEARELEEKVAEAREDLGRAQSELDGWTAAAAEAEARAATLGQEAEAARNEALQLAREADEAKRAAEAAGGTVPPAVDPSGLGTGPRPAPTREGTREAALQAARDLQAAQREVTLLQQAVEGTAGDPALEERLAEALERLAQAEQNADKALQLYQAMGGEETLEELTEPDRTSPQDAMRELLQRQIDDARAEVAAAEQALREALHQLESDPSDPALEQAVEDAKQRLADMADKVDRALANYRGVLGEEPEAARDE